MFLINSLLINSYLETKSPTLEILKFNKKGLQHTFYYFRFGGEGSINGEAFYIKDCSECKSITLEPGDFAEIKSLETFNLGEQVMGIIGQSSDLIQHGIQLLHSPFIDSGYKGQLSFGLKNLSNKKFHLEFEKTIIGKVSFFDISDTYPIDIKKNSIFYKRYFEEQ